MKEVARFFDAGEAQIALGYLRSLGLDVELADYHTLSARPELRFGGNEFRLLASRAHAWQATKALEERRAQPSGPSCPDCGTGDSRRLRRPFPQSLFALLARLSGRPNADPGFRCTRCGHRWQEVEDEPEHEL